jgi:hypothetical protein
VNGTPINGSQTLTFRLYDDATNGSAQWTETHPAVTLEDGYYSVELGDIAPLDDVALGADRWLTVGVGVSADELSRVRLAAVPWSLRTQVAEVAHGVQLTGVSGGLVPGACSIELVGTLRYNTDSNALEFCQPIEGAYTWSDVAASGQLAIIGDDTSGRSYSNDTYARSCQGYRSNNAYNAEPNGQYLIQPIGFSVTRVQCDMTTDGGGWTLVFREDFTDVEDGPSSAEMNSSAGDPITGEGRIDPVAMFGGLGATDVLYDLETQKLVTPDVSQANWTWFMSDTSVAQTRNMSTGAYFVGGTSFGTIYHHKWSGSQGQVSTNTVWDNALLLDYGPDANHGWALWTAANGQYKRTDGFQTPTDVTVRMWLR